ncbi:MAG: S8 family serine peptidase, partial [Acidobacteria bacterium]|nr:S8 family serine peptidase [Acidobacteriota bacterium]
MALLSLATFSVSARRNSQSPDSEAAANPSSLDGAKASRIEFVPGEILVRYRSDAEARREESAATPLRKNGREISVKVERFDGSDLVKGLRQARVRPEDTLDAIVALKSQPNVLYAEPNYIWRKKNTPNDARYGDLWALKNTGQSGSNDYIPAVQPGTVGEDIDAELAWNKTTGDKSVVVAVIDEGIDVNHADLKDNIWVNPGETAGDGVDNDGNGFADDVNGWDFTSCIASSLPNCGDGSVYDGTPANGKVDSHGTHVAGTIGARGNNGVGVVGVNWQVSIMSIKVLGATGSGSSSNIIRGYNYVRMMKQRGINVRVTNNSYGGPGYSLAAFDAISQLNQADILVVVAAGNDAQDNFNSPDFPASYDLPNVLAVAATDRFGQLAIFSNFGARAVSMGAPGRGILSTTPHNYPTPQYTDPDGSTYSFFSGTSMATPQVAGAAALALSVNSGLSVQNLRGVLAYSGEVLPSLQGVTTTGRRLNAYNTILSAQENDLTAPASAANLQMTAQNGRTVTLQWIAPGDDGNAGTASDYDFFFISPAGKRLLLPTTLLPATAGTAQSATVSLPYLNYSGTVELRTYDNAGNFSTASLPVSVAQNAGSDPYVVIEGAPEGLSTGGTSLALNADDSFKDNQPLPFSFPFYGVNRTSINVSTNGALYFSKIPRNESGIGLDAGSSVQALQGQTMIAGLWDDLRTDRTGGNVFVVQPDSSRVIYRWEGVTYNSGEQPINFEIELRSNGTIIFRYGAGQSSP